MTLSTLISWTLPLALLTSNMAAASPAVVAPNQKLSLHSQAGQQLLQHAQVLEPSHHHHHHVRSHGRRNNYQYGYNYDTDDALSNLANLYIQYTGCSSYVAADNNNNNNGNNNNGNNQNDNDNGNNGNDNNGDNDGLYMNNLVLFTLCSSEGCSDCSGQYAANMQEFLDTYTELQMQDQEYQCEYVRERCYCSYNNGNNNNNYDGNGNYQNSYETCLAQCYSNAGLDGCMNEYYGGEEFRLQEYLECSYAFGDDDDDNNNIKNQTPKSAKSGHALVLFEYLFGIG
uniref:Uncharacterized protein n=1 Tax=Entomoneis paludosa TaxID=265537 RepID=A0A7S2YDT8_9STRA